MKQKHRWWRFSIRSLLIAITVIAIGLGWRVDRAFQQRAAVVWIEANGGKVEYDIDGQVLFAGRPTVIRSERLVHNDPSIDFLCTVKRVQISSSDKPKSAYPQLLGIPLEKLACLNGLEGLLVGGVDSDSLAPLAGMTQLKELWLTGKGISDISVVQNFKQLQRLMIHESHVKDLAPLGECEDLVYVSLESDQTYRFGSMAKLKSLENISLKGGQVDDFAALAEVESLQRLVLVNVQVTDWKSIAKMKQLVLLRIQGDKQLSHSDLKEIQKALPNTRLYLDLPNDQ